MVSAKTFDATAFDDGAYSIQQTSDGGYIVAGVVDSSGYGAGFGDLWVFKLDNGLNIQWEKTYGAASEEGAYAIQQTADGGYVVAGYTFSSGAGDADFWILKLDASGNVTWQKAYGGINEDVAQAIRQTSDGGYIVVGRTLSFSAGTAWVLKLNSSGSIVWQKVYGGTGNVASPDTVQQTSDGGYIIAGEMMAIGSTTMAGWVLKLDGSGTVLWQNTYNANQFDHFYFVQQTSDSGYIVAGLSSTTTLPLTSYAWIVKLSSSGSVVWNKTYGVTGSDYAAIVRQTSDGGYIVAGAIGLVSGNSNTWVLKLDSSGNVMWQKAYGGGGDWYPGGIQQTSDGGYVSAGITAAFGSNISDAWVMKLDGYGDIAGCPGAPSPAISVNSPTVAVSSLSIAGVATSVTPVTTLATVGTTGPIVNEVCPF